VVAVLFGTAGGILSHLIRLYWPPGAVLGAGLGLFVGLANQRRLSVGMPPIFAGLFAALGAAVAWAPHGRGAALWQLNDVRWVLGLWGVLAGALFALALEREHRRKLRIEARAKRIEDEELRKQIEARKAAYQRAFDRAQAEDEEPGGG
jgi:hypothetical protein